MPAQGPKIRKWAPYTRDIGTFQLYLTLLYKVVVSCTWLMLRCAWAVWPQWLAITCCMKQFDSKVEVLCWKASLLTVLMEMWCKLTQVLSHLILLYLGSSCCWFCCVLLLLSCDGWLRWQVEFDCCKIFFDPRSWDLESSSDDKKQESNKRQMECLC